MATTENWMARPAADIGGELTVPGDKSISHRAVMLGALADGVTDVTNFLPGADCQATATAMQAMGVAVETLAPERLRVHGVGVDGLRAPSAPLDLGNSGTSMRLLCGLLAGQPFDTTLTGDASLSRRPMRRVTGPLGSMGAGIETSAEGTAPLTIRGGQTLTGFDYTMPLASAQVKSAVLLAGIYARGRTWVREPKPTRDHTERMLRGFGYAVDTGPGFAALNGGGRLTARDLKVPGDLSSAAFFLVAAALRPGARVTVHEVGINPTRLGVLHVLERMGARVQIRAAAEQVGEPVASVTVEGRPLKGIEIGADLVALAIDELPVLFVAAACAEGETIVTGAEELRVKESDRVAAMAEGLTALGIEAEARPDGIRIRGGRLGAGRVDSHGDHRIAMAFAVAGQVAAGPVEIRDCTNVRTSFPGFLEAAARVGLNVERRG